MPNMNRPRDRPRSHAGLRHQPADLLHHHRVFVKATAVQVSRRPFRAAERRRFKSIQIQVLDNGRSGWTTAGRRARGARQRRAHERGASQRGRAGLATRWRPRACREVVDRCTSAHLQHHFSTRTRRTTRIRDAGTTTFCRRRGSWHRPGADARFHDQPADLLHHHDLLHQGAGITVFRPWRSPPKSARRQPAGAIRRTATSGSTPRGGIEEVRGIMERLHVERRTTAS